MGDWWNISDEHKRAILLLEAVGLLHDVGKLTDRFLWAQAEGRDRKDKDKFYVRAAVDPGQVFSQSSSPAIQRFVRRVAAKEAPYQELSAEQSRALLECTFALSGHRYSVAELLLTHKVSDLEEEISREQQSKPMQISQLVRTLHGISHYEKEEPPDNEQPYKLTYQASPFGHESQIQVETNQGLSAALNALPLQRIDEMATEKRQSWLEDVRNILSQGLGDTRRPTNEVTLWDWGYTVASFAKAALPYVLDQGWPDDLKRLRWRVLRVNIDLSALYSRAHRITDLLGSQAAAYDALARVKTLLEETYALANELYRDASGIYFLFPDFDLPAELKQRILSCFDADLRPIVELSAEAVCAADLDPRSENGMHSARLIALPRKQAARALQQPIRTGDNLYLWAREWEGVEAEICTACGLRPIAYGVEQVYAADQVDYHRRAASARHVCGVCLQRREGRAERWAKECLEETIWTDEVADLNGRFALVVGRFDLDGWLDGTLVQTLAVGEKKQPTKGPSPARLRRVWETTQAFWQTIWDPPDNGGRPVVPPTGHRLEIRGSLLADDSAEGLGAYHAYELRSGATTLSVVWAPAESGQHGRFITADNLACAAKLQGWAVPARAESEEALDYDSWAALKAAEWWIDRLGRSPSVVVEEPVGYGGKHRRLGLLRKPTASALEGRYKPVVPILSEPSCFMALVPASKALDVVRAIKQRHEREMGKVRDRLPLHIGLVFAPRRTPLRAVLEAGQAMLAEVEPDWTERGQLWKVLSVRRHVRTFGSQEVTERVDLQLAAPGPGMNAATPQPPVTIDWSISTVMGDGKTEDLWYTHLLTDKPAKLQEPEKESMLPTIHVTELQQGAQVWVRPSHFDFEFLDTSARRFDISYDEHGRRRGRPTRPYLLEHLERLDELWSLMHYLETTQINAIGGTIEAARQDWSVGWGQEAEQDSVFRRFVEDTLAAANWPRLMPWRHIDPAKREQLIAAAVRGELADVLELQMEILKQRPEREEEAVP